MDPAYLNNLRAMKVNIPKRNVGEVDVPAPFRSSAGYTANTDYSTPRRPGLPYSYGIKSF
jgi:hypothetical protein